MMKMMNFIICFTAQLTIIRAGYHNTKYLGLATSKSPAGPFIQWTGINSDGNTIKIGDPIFVLENIGLDHDLYKEGRGFIDASPFVDPLTKEKYLYFTQNRNVDKTNRIWGMRMKDWATPDYSTVKVLTKLIKLHRKVALRLLKRESLTKLHKCFIMKDIII